MINNVHDTLLTFLQEAKRIVKRQDKFKQWIKDLLTDNAVQDIKTLHLSTVSNPLVKTFKSVLDHSKYSLAFAWCIKCFCKSLVMYEWHYLLMVSLYKY